MLLSEHILSGYLISKVVLKININNLGRSCELIYLDQATNFISFLKYIFLYTSK